MPRILETAFVLIVLLQTCLVESLLNKTSNIFPMSGRQMDPVAGFPEVNFLRCWRCDYDDTHQCVKHFDFTKHKHEVCDGKCLKAFEKVEARTKEEIEKAQLTPTIRKCVTQKEILSLNVLGINTQNGCHDIRTAKRKHKLYCFCENDLCNSGNSLKSYSVFVFLLFLVVSKVYCY